MAADYRRRPLSVHRPAAAAAFVHRPRPRRRRRRRRRRAGTVGHDHRPRPPLTARSPEDLLAAVPVVLGFVPQRLRGDAHLRRRARAFHARVDLPADAARASPRSSSALLEPGRRHRVRRVVFVALHRRRRARPDACARPLVAGVRARRASRSIDVLRADGGRWFPRAAPAPGDRPRAACPTTSRAHPFTAAGGARRPGHPRARATSWPRPLARRPRAASPRWPRRCAALPDARRRRDAGRLGARPGRGAASPARSRARRRRGWRGCCARSRDVRVRDAACAPMTRDDGAGARRALDRRWCAGAPDDLVRRRRRRCSAFAAWLAGPRRAGLVRARPVPRGRPRPPARPAAWPSCSTQRGAARRRGTEVAAATRSDRLSTRSALPSGAGRP